MDIHVLLRVARAILANLNQSKYCDNKNNLRRHARQKETLQQVSNPLPKRLLEGNRVRTAAPAGVLSGPRDGSGIRAISATEKEHVSNGIRQLSAQN
jgi:hypothetical protein